MIITIVPRKSWKLCRCEDTAVRFNIDDLVEQQTYDYEHIKFHDAPLLSNDPNFTRDNSELYWRDDNSLAKLRNRKLLS